MTVTRGQKTRGQKTVGSAKVVVLRYPDGGAWLDQEAIVTQVFGVIVNELSEAAKRGG